MELLAPPRHEGPFLLHDHTSQRDRALSPQNSLIRSKRSPRGLTKSPPDTCHLLSKGDPCHLRPHLLAEISASNIEQKAAHGSSPKATQRQWWQVPGVSPSIRGDTNSRQSNWISSLHHFYDISDIDGFPHNQVLVGTTDPSDVLFSMLQRCIDQRDLAHGTELHHIIITTGLDRDAFLGSHLIRMFALFERLSEANQVFSRLSDQSVFSWSCIISAHTRLGENGKAIRLYNHMRNSCLQPDEHIFVGALKACSSLANLKQARAVHAHVLETGVESDEFVGSTIVEMYSKCSSLEDAGAVFNRLPARNTVTFSVLVTGYIQQGDGEKVLQLFKVMLQEGVQPDQVTFVSIFKACSSLSALSQGIEIFSYLVETGFNWETIVGNALIHMYISCGRLEEAAIVFNRLLMQDVVSWTTLIAGCIQHGLEQRSLQLFEAMQHAGVEPNSATLVLILKACSSLFALQQGRRVHCEIVENGFELDECLGSSLIDMYGKCGSPVDAEMVFEKLSCRNIVTWSALISAFSENESGDKAWQLYEQMQEEGIFPDRVTLLCAVKACSSLLCIDRAREIHIQVTEHGFELEKFIGNALIDLYAKLGCLKDACVLSHRLPERSVITWSTLIAGYTLHGHGHKAVQMFEKLLQVGVKLDATSFVCMLKTCSSVSALEQGRQIHQRIIENGCECDRYIKSAVIDMYANCASLEDASRMFERMIKDNAVMWSALMSGYAQSGNYQKVVQYFEGMQQLAVVPDDVCFLTLLSACSQLGLVEEGCAYFKLMREEYSIRPSLNHLNSMADVLGHKGYLNQVEDLLETIPFASNVVGWTSLLTSCTTHLNVEVAERTFDHFVSMDQSTASGYVLMKNIYSTLGMWQGVEKVEELRRYGNRWKKPGKAFIEIGSQVHDFIVGDKTHPESAKIYAKLDSLNMEMGKESYKPLLDREDALCGRCGKLAVALGLICTEEGTTIRVAKNLRVCDNCHSATKLILNKEMQEIYVIDTCCIHKFHNAAYSCPTEFLDLI